MSISPFSLLEQLNPTHLVRGITGAAEAALSGSATQSSSFGNVLDKLDVNDDGQLNGADALGGAVILGSKLFDTLGNVMGVETTADKAAARVEAEAQSATSQSAIATAVQEQARSGNGAAALMRTEDGKLVMVGTAGSAEGAAAVRDARNAALTRMGGYGGLNGA